MPSLQTETKDLLPPSYGSPGQIPQAAHHTWLPIIESNTPGKEDGSVSKGFVTQAQGPDFDPKNLCKSQTSMPANCNTWEAETRDPQE